MKNYTISLNVKPRIAVMLSGFILPSCFLDNHLTPREKILGRFYFGKDG